MQLKASAACRYRMRFLILAFLPKIGHAPFCKQKDQRVEPSYDRHKQCGERWINSDDQRKYER